MPTLTGAQIRMARAALRWSLHDLADHAGISRATAQRMELDDDKPAATQKSLDAVLTAFQAAGCAFKDGGWNVGPAVRAPSPALRREQEQAKK